MSIFDSAQGTFYGPPAPLPDSTLFATKGYNTQSYIAPYAANNSIWSQQRTTNVGVNGRPLTGNYPDPIVQLRQMGADEQLRKTVDMWKDREDRTNRQMKFNFLDSASDTSFVATREDTQENYALVMQKIPYEFITDNMHLGLLLLGIWILFK
jgi:hypothetical protein